MALPCLIAVWMTSGFYLALGPSLAAQVLHSPDLLWGGLVIFLLNGVGTAATVVARRASGPATMLAGLFLSSAHRYRGDSGRDRDGVGCHSSSPVPRWRAQASARRCWVPSGP